MSQAPLLVILAGGASSRMWPLREKSLLRFGDDPLLLAQLRRYQALGFEEIAIIANPENDGAIRALAGQLGGASVVTQTEAKGMGDAILRARPLLAGRPHTPLYVTQVHDVVDDRLHADMLAAFRADPAASYIAGCEMDDYFPGGYLLVDGAGRITGMVEKPGAARRPGNLVNIVAHIHADAAALMEAIAREYARDVPTDDHYERAMDRLMQAQVYRVVPYRGAWNALKYPWQVLDIMAHFLSQITGQAVAESAFVADTARLVGDVVIGDGAKIFPGAAVVGPAYIGVGTIVGNNSLVRNSMVLDHCEVGFTSEVARSYVAGHCAMHACRVLDSIFAPRVNFSAGCTTANLRIDRGHVYTTVKGERLDSGRDKFGAVIGAGAFLGVDVMTMPGVKIGENAQIGPGTHVLRDVADGQRVYVRQQQVMINEA